jgi:hypothetical protein
MNQPEPKHRGERSTVIGSWESTRAKHIDPRTGNYYLMPQCPAHNPEEYATTYARHRSDLP